MSTATYAVKPGYNKGGKGRFTRVAWPCEFEFSEEHPPVLHVHHCPSSNGWLALLATIISAVLAQVIAQATGFMVFPGLIIWYLIINAIRKNKVDFDLSQVQQVVADAKKKEISVLGTIAGKETWVGLKCRDQFSSIVDRLKQSGKVSVTEGKVQTSQLGMIIVLVVFVILIALIIVGVATSK